jgi:hypothetical protein
MWFECKICYEKFGEGDLPKKVTETFLVEASSHAEAEAEFALEMQPYISGENEIVAIRKVKIAELFLADVSDTWYWKARVAFIMLDERSGAEKRKAVTMLVQGDDIGDAVEVLNEGMKGTMSDYEVVGLTKTAIMDVIVRNGKA